MVKEPTLAMNKYDDKKCSINNCESIPWCSCEDDKKFFFRFANRINSLYMNNIDGKLLKLIHATMKSRIHHKDDTWRMNLLDLNKYGAKTFAG